MTNGGDKFKRLPFGIRSASEVFQHNVSEIIENIEGARNSQDDIIIWADTQKKLTERTKEVLDAIKLSGMKLNRAKCIFFFRTHPVSIWYLT